MDSIFSSIRNYINGCKSVGEDISRSELRYVTNQCSDSTMDTYRNKLTNVGYLKKTSAGHYQKIKDIPESLTTHELSRLSTLSLK